MEEKLFVKNSANEDINVEEWFFNDYLTDIIWEDNYLQLERDGFVDRSYQCHLCGKSMTWAVVFSDSEDFGTTFGTIHVGVECAKILDSKNKWEALELNKQKRMERIKLDRKYRLNSESFEKEYPELYQASSFFQQFNPVIEDILRKSKYGLSDRQLQYLHNLILDEWEKQVFVLKRESNLVPKLKEGTMTAEVTIKRYFWKEGHNGWYGYQKTVFETNEGQTIFTGKTQALVEFLDNDCYFDDDKSNFWKLEKKERKSELQSNKNYFEEGTKGIATFEITSLFEDGIKGSGKIKSFIPTQKLNKGEEE